ncbi:MAG: hypothetical protein RTU63_07340 [Candidatus Thorarchaeota archaeon]
MAFGKRGAILLSVFLAVDGFLIWWINSSSRTSGFAAAPVASGDVTLVTYALIGAAVISILGAIMFKSKPVPAC